MCTYVYRVYAPAVRIFNALKAQISSNKILRQRRSPDPSSKYRSTYVKLRNLHACIGKVPGRSGMAGAVHVTYAVRRTVRGRKNTYAYQVQVYVTSTYGKFTYVRTRRTCTYVQEYLMRGK